MVRTYGFVKSEKRLEPYNLKEWKHIVFRNERWSNYSYFMEETLLKGALRLLKFFIHLSNTMDSRNTNPHVSKSSGVNHTTSVSRPQLKCYQVKDKVVPNNSQVKFKKKEVEDHHRISSISKKTKSVTACNDSSNSKTSNVNAVCAKCGKCVFNSNHDACVSRYLNDMNARTKKPNVVPISASKPKRKTNKSVATPHKKIVASDTTI
ncbi:hypothetical protein Tco_0015370 [Tanacetum coccineum]